MKVQHVLCPLAALLDSDEKVYGMSSYSDQSEEEDMKRSSAVRWTLMLIWLVSFVLAIMGVVKAFSCGAVDTNFGLTGTGWGVIILVLGLLVTPLGGMLGIAFAIGGSCRLPGLV